VTYLLSQIFVSLLLAALAGGAIGWILHGFRARRREAELTTVIARHATALGQAQQERQMIADDYDDMKIGLESRIGELQVETRRVPELRDNLEKSQQLIQQMMKTHESELAEVSNSNTALQSELDGLKLQQQNDRSEISALRKTNGELGGHNSKDTEPGHTDESDSQSPDKTGTRAKQSASQTQTDTPTGNVPNRSTAQTITPGTTASETTSAVAVDLTDSSGLPEQDYQTGFNDETVTQDELLELESEIEEMRGYDRAFNATSSSEPSDNSPPVTTRGAAVAASTVAATTAAVSATTGSSGDNASTAANELDSADGSLAERAPASEETVNRLRDRFSSSGANDATDDLQTIHGIGPVIEQSLNDIGINSYQQIAELTRREIEEIAEILEIFPGRIERDNWIGSARKLARESGAPGKHETTSTSERDKDSVAGKGKEKSLHAEEV